MTADAKIFLAASQEDELKADETLLAPLRAKLEALDLEDKCGDEIQKLIRSEEDMGRFLVARHNNLHQALIMAKATVRWRATIQPSSLTIANDFPNAYAQGVWRFAGTTKKGWTVLHVTACHWNSFAYSVDEYIKMVAYHVERTSTKNFLIFDMKNMGYLVDMRKLRQLAHILSDYYPERLGCACFVNCDWVFDKFFHIAIRWVDPRTQTKCIDFRDNGAEFLLQHIDSDQLTTELGGSRQEPWPLESY
jgi:hypothetical protein